jgi:hypothetical protein
MVWWNMLPHMLKKVRGGGAAAALACVARSEPLADDVMCSRTC